MIKLRLWLALAMIVSVSIHAYAQGSVRGKITDENGESLIGVSVYLKEDASKGAPTDLDGYFSLAIPAGVNYTLVVAYVSYETIEAPVLATEGQVVVMDFIMKSSSVTLGEVEVVAKQERRSQYYMENIKKKSASTLDYMSGDLMSKIGDNNVSAAISRVTGVATNGPFITVRGLGDRYVQTCVNGSLVPTLDPFTNNIKLDLFPSSFIDNIVITKTASPDILGDWAAAYISLETKDNPDKLSIFVESKVGYNPQTSFKNVITNETSPTDWLGYDNGYRDVNHDQVIGVIPQPSAYEQFCALGLTDYYRSIGVTESWSAGSPIGDTYFRLGLVELGLLGKAFINDEQSVKHATELFYADDLQNQAFRTINQKAEKSMDDFASNWGSFKKKAPLNFSQTFSIGNQSTLFGRPFSYLAGFRYGSNVQYDAHSTLSRSITSQLDSLGNPIVDQQYNQEYSKFTNGWTALATVNFKLNPTNSFSLLFMPNIIGTNSLREGVDLRGASSYDYAFVYGQFYEERSQFVYQYKSEHYFPAFKARLNLSASYADGNSSAPDFKRLQYFSNDSITYRLDETISDARRDFRYLDENILDTKASIEVPLGDKPGYISKLKIGATYLDKQREAFQNQYLNRVANGASTVFANGRLDELYASERFDIHTDSATGLDRIDLYYTPVSDPSYHTIGYAKVTSGFVMVDESITEKLRVSAGVRAEYSDIFTDIKEFYDLGYAADDLRRNTDAISFILTPSKTQQWNFLPSVNLIYQVKPDENYPSNLRLSYSRTLARPSLREFTESIVRDFELNEDVFGNADLKFVEIDNYDFRYENYFQTGHYLSVSFFYKNFNNHIELVNSNYGFTWTNADKSNVYGIELEGKLKLGPHFEFRSNVSLVKSYTQVQDQILLIENGVKSWVTVGVIERTMFGQAPYVVNAILNYTANKGFAASLSYNVQGAKLVLNGAGLAPDIYEIPRHLVNAKISHPIGKHFSVSLTVKDILNADVRRSYKYDEGYLLDFDHFTYGTEYFLGVAYNL